LICILSIVSLTSCATAAYAQSEDEVYVTSFEVEVNPNVVVAYGVPVYDDMNLIMYYVYRGWYYYPYWLTDRYYFHASRHPLSIDYYRRWYKPVPMEFHRRMHERGIQIRRSHHMNGGRNRIHNRPNVDRHRGFGGARPNVNSNRSSHGMNRVGSGMHNNRPMSPQRSSTRMGGRR
jgi:hypothetical protein